MKAIIIIVLFLCASGVNAQTQLEVDGEAKISIMRRTTSTRQNVVRLSNGNLAVRQYHVGDLAQGGIIFWVDESGEHGLVCSQNDLESTSGDFSLQWGTSTPIITAATGGSFGSGTEGKGAGAMNTLLIVSSDRGDTDSAARLCADLLESEYGDWYLPSKGELNLMYMNLHLNDLGGFNEFGIYWSSSEVSSSKAWRQSFNNGSQIDVDKDNVYRVRAIRVF